MPNDEQPEVQRPPLGVPAEAVISTLRSQLAEVGYQALILDIAVQQRDARIAELEAQLTAAQTPDAPSTTLEQY